MGARKTPRLRSENRQETSPKGVSEVSPQRSGAHSRTAWISIRTATSRIVPHALSWGTFVIAAITLWTAQTQLSTALNQWTATESRTAPDISIVGIYESASLNVSGFPTHTAVKTISSDSSYIITNRGRTRTDIVAIQRLEPDGAAKGNIGCTKSRIITAEAGESFPVIFRDPGSTSFLGRIQVTFASGEQAILTPTHVDLSDSAATLVAEAYKSQVDAIVDNCAIGPSR